MFDDDALKGMGCLIFSAIILLAIFLIVMAESPYGLEDILSP